ncbi:hypothetical protein XENOCAPTIV_022536, partial [Xenoophorus captivus]
TELRALQMTDLDLDSRLPPAVGQPVNLPASQSSQLASPPEHQPVSLPTHPPAVQADLTKQSGPSGAEGVIMSLSWCFDRGLQQTSKPALRYFQIP